MPKQEPSGEVPDISVSGSQGVFAGSGNQYNTWEQKPPLDPAAMRDLNPHIAVARLQRESHDELVSFFIRAQPGDVSEILEVFVSTDLLKIVAAFGDLNRRKATELISALHKEHVLEVLGDLPEAAEAIARNAGIVGWADVAPLEPFMGGYARTYDNGHVCWSRDFGIARTTGAIDDYYWTESGHDWGFPVGNQEFPPTSPYGTTGVRQKFQHSTVYSCKHGVFLLTDAMCYEDEGGCGGWLGFPVSKRQRNMLLAERQMFEGGAIYSYVAEGPEVMTSFAVRREVADVLSGRDEWRPLSKEASTVSSSGISGTVQHFELTAIGVNDETAETVALGSYETTVYSSEAYGAVLVTSEISDYYRKLDAEKSWLGFPIKQATWLFPRHTAGFQEFEKGRIYWRTGKGTFAVPSEVIDMMKRSRNTEAPFGFPVTEQQPIGTGESDRIQFFENAVVTLRDGKGEIWVRSSERAVEPDATATPKARRRTARPWPDYDKTSIAVIRARLRNLSVEQLIQIIDYEKSHAARENVIAMCESRIARSR